LPETRKLPPLVGTVLKLCQVQFSVASWKRGCWSVEIVSPVSTLRKNSERFRTELEVWHCAATPPPGSWPKTTVLPS
jgi:hypothetical protein